MEEISASIVSYDMQAPVCKVPTDRKAQWWGLITRGNNCHVLVLYQYWGVGVCDEMDKGSSVEAFYPSEHYTDYTKLSHCFALAVIGTGASNLFLSS